MRIITKPQLGATISDGNHKGSNLEIQLPAVSFDLDIQLRIIIQLSSYM